MQQQVMESVQKQRLGLYLYSAVVRVQQQLGQSHNLRCAVPAIRTMYQDWSVVAVHSVDNQQGCLQQQGQMLQPLGALQCRKPAADTDDNHDHKHISGSETLLQSLMVKAHFLSFPTQSSVSEPHPGTDLWVTKICGQ